MKEILLAIHSNIKFLYTAIIKNQYPKNIITNIETGEYEVYYVLKAYIKYLLDNDENSVQETVN